MKNFTAFVLAFTALGFILTSASCLENHQSGVFTFFLCGVICATGAVKILDRLQKENNL